VSNESIDAANEALRAKGYGERDLAVFPTPMGPDRAILKGAKLLSPFSDDAATVLHLVRDVVPPAAELTAMLRPADLRSRL
jgi:hypothetical protein